MKRLKKRTKGLTYFSFYFPAYGVTMTIKEFSRKLAQSAAYQKYDNLLSLGFFKQSLNFDI